MTLLRIITIFIFIKIILTQNIISLNKCGQGCLACQLNEDESSSCSLCDADFILDQTSKSCIYQECPENLYLDDWSQNKKCVLICNDLYVGNELTHTCEQIEQCSLYSQNQNQLVNGISIEYAFHLNSNIIMILYEGYTSLINRQTGMIYKTSKVEDEILQYQIFGGKIFVLTNKNEVFLQDEVLKQKYYITNSQEVGESYQTQLIRIDQFIICLLRINYQSSKIVIKPIYNLKTLTIIQQTIKESEFDFSGFQLIKIINSVLILEKLSQINLIHITVKEDNQQPYQFSFSIQLQCSGSFSSFKINTFLDYDNQKEYIFTLNTNNNPFYYVNFVTQVCQSIYFDSYSSFDSFKLYSLSSKNKIIYAQTNINLVLIESTNFQVQHLISSTNLSQDEQILDSLMIKSSSGEYLIFLLTNYQRLMQYEYTQSGNVHYIKSDSNTIRSPLKLIPIYQKDNYLDSIVQEQFLIQSMKELQVIQKNNQQELSSYRIKQYSIPLDIKEGTVSQIILIEDLQLLISCIQSGYIQIFKISSGYVHELSQTITFENESCLKIENANNNYLLVQLQHKIVLVNLSIGRIVKEFIISNSQTSNINISTNGHYTLINYNNCIELYENDNFTIIFRSIDNDLVLQNKQIKVLPNMQLIIQRDQEILKVSLNQSDQSYLIIKSYQFESSISYFDCIFSKTSITNYEFDLDEILIIQSPQNFVILTKDFLLDFQIILKTYGSFTTIKRTLNDKQVYFMLKSEVKKNNKNSSVLLAVRKGSNDPGIIWEQLGYEYSVLLDDPISAISKKGEQYYQVRHYLLLGFFSVLKEFKFFPQTSKNLITGHNFVQNDMILAQEKTLKSNSNIQIQYAGNKSGRIQSWLNQINRYEILPISQYLFNDYDEIQTVIQSIKLNKYFVLTKYLLLIFNIHTDILEDRIVLSEYISATSLLILENLNSMVFFYSHKIILRSYQGANLLKNYQTDLNISISNIIYLQTYNQFIVYGSGVLLLDDYLKQKQEIIPKGQYYLNQCQRLSNELFCKSSTNQLLIIDIVGSQIINSLSIVGFQTDGYQIVLDEKFNHLILVDNFLLAYTLSGDFLMSLKFKLNTIQKIFIQEDYVFLSQIISTLSLKSYYELLNLFQIIGIVILKREDLTIVAEIDSIVGFQILDFFYIPFFKQIIYYCDNSLFSQIYVLDIKSKSIVGRVQSYFTQNGSGIVINATYDNNGTYLTYLDQLGNFNLILFYDSFSIYGNAKILEIVDLKQKIINYTIDFVTGDILLYCTKSLYKINYNLLGDKYVTLKKTNKSMFTVIQDNDDLVNSQILVRGDDNYIYRYQDKQLLYEINYSDKIISLRYLKSQQILVIVFEQYFLVFLEYEYGQQESLNYFLKSSTYYLDLFIDDNVFLTLDKKLVHYNFAQNKPLIEIQLPPKSQITKTYIQSQLQVIIIGFLDGDLFIYNKLNQKQQYLSTLKSNQVVNNSIKFILEKSQSLLLICTINSELIELDLTTLNHFQPKNLQSLISNFNGLSLLLDNLVYDSVNSRIIFQYFKFKYGIVWNAISNKVDGYITAGNNSFNRILLFEQYIVAASSFQLNIYQRNGEIKYINSIRLNIYNDEISKFFVINKNIILVSTLNRIDIFYFSEDSISLMMQKQINNPFIIAFNYQSVNKHYRVIGLGDTGIFDSEVKSLTTANENSITCGQLVNKIDSQRLEQDILMVEQSLKEVKVVGGRQLVNNEDSINYYFVDIESSYLPFLNNILINKGTNLQQQIIFSPQSTSISQFIINSQLFSQLEQASVNLKSINIKFQEGTSDIWFNKKIKQFYSQNMRIENINNFADIRFNFLDMDEIFIFNMTLSSNTNKDSLYRENSSDCHLFLFQNVKTIRIYNLTIEHNQLSSKKDLFYFRNVSSVIIQDSNIQNNVDISKVFQFELVINATINRVNILNNTQQNDQQSNNVLFQFNSCLDVALKGVVFQQNINYRFFFITNTLVFKTQKVTLSNDNLSILNTRVSSNDNKNLTIINIESSQIFINDIIYYNNFGNIKLQDSSLINIQNSSFKNNIGQDGGSLAIYGLILQIKIVNTIIVSNQAIGSGGGVYIEDNLAKDIQIDESSLISENKSLIGGGLRIVNKISNSYIPPNYPYQSVIHSNKAELYGNNACTSLKGVNIENSQSFTKDEIESNPFYYLDQYQFLFSNFSSNNGLSLESQLLISSFKSGGYIKLNFYLVDEEQRILSFSKEKLLKNMYPSEITSELKYLSLLIVTEDSGIQLAGQTILNYNVYNDDLNCFQITQLIISSIPSAKKNLEILSSINKYNLEQIEILFEINFRKCLQGEVIFEQSPQIQICQFCSDGSYSLQNPDEMRVLSEQSDQNSKSTSKSQVNICKKCPDNALKCFGNRIYLQNGYWRKDNLSDEIIACNEQFNSCLAETFTDMNQICSEGYLGPLCEECNIQGELSNGQRVRYVSSIYYKQCRECSSAYLQVLFLIAQIFIIMMYLIYSTKSFVENYIYIQSCYYLRQMKMIPLSKPPVQSQSTSYNKILINYLQFTSLLVTQPSLLPIEINVLPNILGSSNRIITLNFSCIIPQKQFELIGKANIYSIFNVALPSTFLAIGLILLYTLTFNQVNIRYFRKYYICTIVQVTYMFFLLDFVSYFTSMLTCRKIGSLTYHTVDLLSLCSDNKVQRVLIPYSAVLLVLWIILPIFSFFSLRRRSEKLQYCQTKFRYGYFYLELKHEFYYWEFVRLYVKISIVIIYTLLRQKNLLLARLIIIIIISSYTKQISVNQPFNSTNICNTEMRSYKILVLKILLCSVNDEYKFILWELGLYLCDVIFICYLCTYLIKVIFNNKKSRFNKLLAQFARRFCASREFSKMLNQNVNFDLFLRWKKIRINLRKIICNEASDVLGQYQNYEATNKKNSPLLTNSFFLTNHQTYSRNQLIYRKTYQSLQKQDISNLSIFH